MRLTIYLRLLILFLIFSKMDFKAVDKEFSLDSKPGEERLLEQSNPLNNVNIKDPKEQLLKSNSGEAFKNKKSEQISDSNKLDPDYSDNLDSLKFAINNIPKDYTFENNYISIRNQNEDFSKQINNKKSDNIQNQSVLLKYKDSQTPMKTKEENSKCYSPRNEINSCNKTFDAADQKLVTNNVEVPINKVLSSEEMKNANINERSQASNFDIENLNEASLSLQDEVNNMFGPSFRSFVFNPSAPTDAKFQICQTSNNESGVCRYIQHCFMPNFVSSINQFMKDVCIIEGRYIGVCCPQFPVSVINVKWTNGLQHVEADDESVNTAKECGIGTNTRIVGGSNANVKAWPWMVALLNNKRKFYCGGSLINNRYVLTAAHCTYGSRNNEIIARLGEFDMSNDEGVHEDYFVEVIKRHGQYTRLTLRNDIALLKLHKPVVVNEFMKTICLPKSNKTYTGKVATLTGWGHVEGGISPFTSDILQEASFPIVTNEECSNIHGINVPPSLICTAAPSKDKGACNGDSGGPLMMLDEEGHWKVIGIVSWGRRGCSTKYPSVFTRVSHYVDWIKEHAT